VTAFGAVPGQSDSIPSHDVRYLGCVADLNALEHLIAVYHMLPPSEPQRYVSSLRHFAPPASSGSHVRCGWVRSPTLVVLRGLMSSPERNVANARSSRMEFLIHAWVMTMRMLSEDFV
jgi:hypothetical protein